MDTIKDRNGKDLMEAEEIKKRWQRGFRMRDTRTPIADSC